VAFGQPVYDDGIAAMSSGRLSTGVAGEAELVWRCWECGETGAIED
jgi:hypothetical protein